MAASADSHRWCSQITERPPPHTPPNPHAAALHHAITVGNGIIPFSVMKVCTESQGSVGFHYPTPVLQCTWTSECSSIQSWALCNLFLYQYDLAGIHRECAGGRFFRKSSREPLLLRVTTDVWVKFTVATNLTALMVNYFFKAHTHFYKSNKGVTFCL